MISTDFDVLCMLRDKYDLCHETDLLCKLLCLKKNLNQVKNKGDDKITTTTTTKNHAMPCEILQLKAMFWIYLKTLLQDIFTSYNMTSSRKKYQGIVIL